MNQLNFLTFIYLLLMLLPNLSYAQESAPDLNALDNKSIDQKTMDQAEAMFFKALKAFQSKQYDQAAMAFQDAYLLIPNPDLIYNIARSRELLGDLKGAVSWYQSYLKTAPVDETAVIHHIKQIGGDMNEGQSGNPQKSNADQKKVEVKIYEEGGSPLAWATLGTSVVALGAGLFLGAEAMSEANHARNVFGLDPKEYNRFKQSAEDYSLYSDISIITGLIALGATTYLWLAVDQEAIEATKSTSTAALLNNLKFNMDPQQNKVQFGYQWGF
jgi:hypothetical protein